ncbi:MAG: hypothetical protein LBI42_07525 [Chitinispirillales bacterium]|jgi:hypothetical protein|nr:hypothetical protein [Chitinispirillales bacterium]
MKKRNHYIVGIHIDDRVSHVPQVQEILTKFGCFIKTRIGLHDIGLHDVGESSCSSNGIIIVELLGDSGRFEEFTSALSGVDGVDVQYMVFEH